jgi:hypothetical protein
MPTHRTLCLHARYTAVLKQLIGCHKHLILNLIDLRLPNFHFLSRLVHVTQSVLASRHTLPRFDTRLEVILEVAFVKKGLP